MTITFDTPAYYNEIDPYAAQYLRNLIASGLIAPGLVDERSIHDVRPADLHGYSQVHFFAGLGVWSYALRLAHWPDHGEVWTASCPCQPFSDAGRNRGTDDPRHLWSEVHRLVRECRPRTVFGEQVAGAGGRGWIANVRSDLEAHGLAFVAAELAAAGFGAPHRRQRYYWVADAIGRRREDFGHDGRRDAQAPGRGEAGSAWTVPRAWDDAQLLECRDGRRRPVERGTFPLVDGSTANLRRLRALGNAIVPQVAASFIRAFIEC